MTEPIVQYKTTPRYMWQLLRQRQLASGRGGGGSTGLYGQQGQISSYNK